MRPSILKIQYCILFLMCFVQLNAQNTTADYIPTGLISDDINAPGRMAVDTDDNVYVADAAQKNIVKYDKQGNYLTSITTDFNPISIAINKNDGLFVGDKGTGNIYKVSQNGNKTLFYAGSTLPNSMAFGLDILYITDSEQKKVIGLDVSGNVVTDFTYDTFTFPTGIAFDKQNNHLIVSEHGGVGEDVQTCGGGSMSWGTTGPLTTIYIFDLNGGLINNFGCFGTDDSEFQRIQGITIGACGNIYAVDPFLGRINVFDDNGNYITKFGTHGDGVGEFNLPMDIIFTSDNRAFVSSMNKGAIDVFSITQNLPSATITSADQTVCSLSDALVEVQLTGAAPWTFTYTVDGLNPIDVVNTNDNPYSITPLTAGLYEVTALTDGTGTVGTCLTGAAYIKQSTPPTATILITELGKCSNDDSGIEVQFTGIAPFTFTYTIDGLNSTEITTINNPYTLYPEQSGIHEITALSDDGCSGTVLVSNSVVTVYPCPTAEITNGNDRINIAAGTSTDLTVAFTGSAPWTFVYYRDDLNPISVTTSVSPYFLTVFEEGTYEVKEVVDAYCSNTVSNGYPEIVFQGLPDPPTATLETTDYFICQGESTNISVQLTGASPWNFSYTIDGLNPTEINTAVSPYSFSTSVYGVYELSAVSDINNTPGSFSGTAQVIELPQPIVDLPEEINICEGDPTYVLDAGEHESYLWSDGSTNRTLVVSATGIYSVTVTNASGCTTSGAANVTILDKPILDLPEAVNTCEGDPYVLDAGVHDSYLWNDGSTNRTLVVSATGIYSVTVTNASGCTTSGSASVTVLLLPDAYFYYDVNALEVQFLNDAYHADSHYWEFGDGTYSTEENPVHTFASKGTYTVTYTALSVHCGAAVYSETIYVSKKPDNEVVHIYPNPSNGEFTLVISPNEPILGQLNISIHTMSGEPIYSGTFDPNLGPSYEGKLFIEIDLVNFSFGSHIVTINASNFVGDARLILQH